MSIVRPVLCALLSFAAACGGETTTAGGGRTGEGLHASPADAPRRVTLTIVGTNDLHGHIASLPLLAGYVERLRELRAADRGAVLLVDGGDMFQGTLESNLVEGESVVVGMNLVGYTVAAVGNHELDYGPVGEAMTPRGPTDDPRGALVARASEASFPFLTANFFDAASGERVAWHANMPATHVAHVAGIRVGFVGVATVETPRTTIHGNVADVRVAPLAETITREAARLRAEGASVVIVAAHAGGKCDDCSNADDTSSCDDEQEIFEVARALPTGAVDAIVAGHTHAGVAHRVAGIPIIESYAYGIAFGRIDLEVEVAPAAAARVVASHVHPPRFLCDEGGRNSSGAVRTAQSDPVRRSGTSGPRRGPDDFERCTRADYEGGQPRWATAIAHRMAPYFRQAAAVESRPIGVEVAAEFAHVGDRESALGNLLADLVREGVDGAEVGLMNGGGIRAPLAAGALDYGAFYRVFPFDNRFATLRLTGAELARVVLESSGGDRSAMSLSGVRARVRCGADGPVVELTRANGRRVRDDETLVVAASDFLATGGSEVLAAANADGRATIDEGEPMRDRLVTLLASRRRVSPTDRAIFDPRRPRVELPGERPIRCHAAPAGGAP